LETEIAKLESDLNESNMEKYGELVEQFIYLDGYNFDTNLYTIFSGMNFNHDLDKKIGELSGGEKIKVLLATILLSNCDILLLDEPTNNIDLDTILFLEKMLSESTKKMIIVSHDEEFLNKICNKIVELDEGKITQYNMRYSEYLIEKEKEYNKRLAEYENAKDRQKEIKERIITTSIWANRGVSKKTRSDNDKIAAGYKKERTSKTSGKISKLTRQLEEIEVPNFERKEEINFDINFDAEKGNKDIGLNDLVCGYADFHTKKVDLVIPFGSRVLIEGPNGSGKTTLIKTIVKKIPQISGVVSVGNKVKFGYIDQNTFDVEDKNITVYKYITEDNDDIDEGYLFSVLDKFNISYDKKNKKYTELSSGERTKVNLAKLAINKVNVLVLDEVTNHLDVETMQLMSDVIRNFSGTIISISHNRKFNKILAPTMVYSMNSEPALKQNITSKSR